MSDVACTKIGFIGFGNIAQAIVQGFLRAKAVPAENIYVCAKNWDKLCKNAEKMGVNPCKDAAEVVSQVDVVFIALKPHLVDEICIPLANELCEKIIVSVALNLPFDEYEQFLIPGTHHISTLPNTPVSVGEGVWVCEKTNSLTKDELNLVQNLLSSCGLVVFVDTNLMRISGSLTGCGPAFMSMFMEALADGAVKYGVPRATAYQLVGQMIAGSGKLAIESRKHPAALKDAVCSPGGVSIRGVAKLEELGLRNAALKAIDEIMAH